MGEERKEQVRGPQPSGLPGTTAGRPGGSGEGSPPHSPGEPTPPDGRAEAAQSAHPGGRRRHVTRAWRNAGRYYTPKERRLAVEAFLASGQDGRGFAKLWGVSYVSLYKWAQRYRDLGPKGLERLTDGPRKPRGQVPLPAAAKQEIAAVKRRFPDFGLRRVREYLARFVFRDVHKI